MLGRPHTSVIVVLLGLALGLAWFDGLSSQYSSRATQTQTAEKSDKTANDKSYPKIFWKTLAADPVAAFTLGLVLVGLFQVGLFYVQLRLIRESLDDAKVAAGAAKDAAIVAKIQAGTAEATLRVLQDTAEKELRAYIFVNEATFQMEPDGRWAILIKLRNSGQTPAYDVRAVVERDFAAPRNEASVFPLTDEADIFPTFTFAPQSPHTIHLPCDEPPLDIARGQDGWYAISQSDMRAYVWGRIDYSTFGKPHWTTFQMVNYFSNVASFSFCAAGNDSSRQ